MAEYKNVGSHVQDLADGRMLAPGESAELDNDALKHPHNEDLLNIGVLIKAENSTSNKKSGAKTGEEE